MSTHSLRGAPFGRSSHKARQLCRQVHEELALALGELDDDVLDGLAIFAVELEGGSTTLRIGLVVPGDRDALLVHAALERASGSLRAGIAAAIHRKRTPLLRFVLVPAEIAAGTSQCPRAVPRAELHGLDDDGMVACNPRDREAAHRADVEGIATAELDEVTCTKCITALARARRDRGDRRRGDLARGCAVEI
jgi:ribosome-binding factor A